LDRRFIVGGALEDGRAQPWPRLFEHSAKPSILNDHDADFPAVLLTTSGTAGDIAVLGAPDVVLGQRVAAFVELADSANSEILDDILTTAKRHLADYIPETLMVVNGLPRNALGKIDCK
jgi:acyl-CoA synthetase (AMP-forming)/AMP-acid ligase II